MGRMYSWLNRGVKETIKDYDNRINQIPKIHAGYAFFHPANYDEFRHVFSVYLVWNGEFNEKLVDAMPPGGYQLHCSVKEAETFLHHKAAIPVFAEILSNQGKLLLKEILLEFNDKCYPVTYNGCEVYSPEEFCFWEIQENEKGMFWKTEKPHESLNSSVNYYTNGSFPVGSYRRFSGNGSFRAGSFRRSVFRTGSFPSGSFRVRSFQSGSYRGVYVLGSYRIGSFKGGLGLGSYTGSFGRGSFSLKNYLTGSFRNHLWQGSYQRGSFRREFRLENWLGGSFRRGYGAGSFFAGSFRTIFNGQNGYLGSYRKTSPAVSGSFQGSFRYQNRFGNGSYSPLVKDITLREEELNYLVFLEEEKMIQEIFGIGSLGYGLNLI